MAEAPLSFQRNIGSLVSGRKRPENWREPENPVRFAYLKLLREKDETRRVLDVDPFAEVYDLRPGLYGIFQESLDGMGDVWSFLIDGPERAMLIDTGFGLGDLKGLVNTLTGGKELIVVNTHGHFDHAYGNGQFGRVYCHEAELPMMQKTLDPTLWDYLFDKEGKGIWYNFRREDLIPFRNYEIVPVPDGTVFDLGGGHEVELVHMGGHTAGHSGYLDRTLRIFFPGDDCCVGNVGIGLSPGSPWATVEGFYSRLEGLTKRLGEFDSLFPSHGLLETGPVMLLSVMEAAQAVLAHPEAYDRRMEGPFGVRYGKYIYESGMLLYNEKNVYGSRAVKIEPGSGE